MYIDLLLSILLIILIIICTIYLYCYMNKCTVVVAIREIKRLIFLIIKTLFEKSPTQLIRIIGKSENGIFDYSLLINSFEEIKNEFDVFVVDKKPLEKENHVYYRFIARYPKITMDEDDINAFLKDLVTMVVKKNILYDNDLDISNFIVVYYHSKSGVLEIAIAKNILGAEELLSYEINIKKNLLKQNKLLKENWKNVN